MKRIAIGKAKELIKRELGISPTALTAPPDMNQNPDYPWYEMHSGTTRIEININDIRQGKFTDKMVCLCVTRENSLKYTEEYFYGDTLEYAAPYTEWKNRKVFCETMNSPETDPALLRLEREARDDCWRHFHEHPVSRENVTQRSEHSPIESLDQLEPERRADDALQGKFKIRICDLHGTYIHDTDSFEKSELDWWISLEMKHINDSQLFSGLTVFEWDRTNDMWMPYRPYGIHDVTYDTGRRSDGKIHEACKVDILTMTESTLCNRLNSAHQILQKSSGQSPAKSINSQSNYLPARETPELK